jgi:hypothetical protein
VPGARDVCALPTLTHPREPSAVDGSRHVVARAAKMGHEQRHPQASDVGSGIGLRDPRRVIDDQDTLSQSRRLQQTLCVALSGTWPLTHKFRVAY